MLDDYKRIYQINPIFLTGGAARGAPGGMMPLLAFTDSVAFGSNLLGSDFYDMDNAFATFQVMPANSNLIEQTIGQYPFANNLVAANAIIKQPINVSMLMLTPMRGPNAWSIKMSTISALKATLDNHNNAGGTYTVVTPAFVFIDMVMLEFSDISMGQNPLPQNAWRLTFHKPLITLAQAAAAQSNLLSKLSAGTQTDGGNVGASSVGSPTGANTPSVGAGGADYSGITNVQSPAALTSVSTPIASPVGSQQPLSALSFPMTSQPLGG
jgi:hypothetical protein